LAVLRRYETEHPAKPMKLMLKPEHHATFEEFHESTFKHVLEEGFSLVICDASSGYIVAVSGFHDR